MIFGVPKEIKTGENRVGLIPDGASALRKLGQTILVERGAGEKSGFTDSEYAEAGAALVSRQELFERADIVVKVKEPLPKEYSLLRPGQTLFGFLHLASSKKLTLALLERKIIGFGIETVQKKDGSFPLLAPMSEIAGKLSVQVGAHFLEKNQGGRGVLLSGISGARPGKVVILGGGTVGRNALQVASGMGARVVVLDVNHKLLRSIRRQYRGVKVALSSAKRIEKELKNVDLLIGAVLVPGAKAPTVVTEAMVRGMPRGSVIVDVAIDQGGCIETIRPTTHDSPIYVHHGVLHYGVQNIPSLVSRTATRALSSQSLPYLKQLARFGIEKALQKSAELRSGVHLWKGQLAHPSVAKSLGLGSFSLRELL
ncbi:MAG: alanine dehydrogenase [Deltaproteobacteria bacterium]|nr:alanine dehydrogenase [Deltaproteobacteria bacterium]